MTDYLDFTVKQIRAGSPIAEGFLYGAACHELMRAKGITESDLRPYRSGAYLARRAMYGEDAAREWEAERKAHHASLVARQ